jgi:multidrug efflux system membrane fusion protein
MQPRVSPILSFLLITLAVGLVSEGCAPKSADAQGQPPAPDVSVARVVTKSAQNFHDFSGRLEAINTVEIHPRVSGNLESVEFQEGANVKKGQLLFRIDARPFKYDADRLDAELRRSQSQLELAKRDDARAQALVKNGSIAQAEFERSSAANLGATATVDSTRASLSLARLNLDFTNVRAPIDGRVSRALITAGNLVSPESALTTIVSDGPLYVQFDVDEATYLALTDKGHESTTVQVGLVDEPGYPHIGKLDFFDNRVDQKTGTVRARAILENPDGRLVPGLFARARLVANTSFSAKLIDDKAILTDQDRKYVFVLDEQNRAQRKNVVIGPIIDGLRVAESGVTDQDRIVVSGVQKIFFPGMPVKPKEVVMGAAPAEAAGGPPSAGG